MADTTGILRTGLNANLPYVYTSSDLEEVKLRRDITLTANFGQADILVDSILVDIATYLASKTISYQWTIADGTIISTADSFIYTPTMAGVERYLLTVTLVDPSSILADIVLVDDHAVVVLPLLEMLYEYTLSYKSLMMPYAISNMDIHKPLSLFPRWSSAYKEHISNASKFLSPILTPLAYIASDVDSILASSKKDGLHTPFGYPNGVYQSIILQDPVYIDTEHGPCTNYGSGAYMSLEHLQVGTIRLHPAAATQRVALDILPDDMLNLVLTKSSRLYLSLIEEVVLSVSITGIAHDGMHTTEVLDLFGSSRIETMNSYKIITAIDSSGVGVRISNVLSGDTGDVSSIMTSQLLPRMVSSVGNYFMPKYIQDENSLYISNGSLVSSTDLYKFDMGMVPDKLLINNLLDGIMLKDNALYSFKLSLDYSTVSLYSSNTNNNAFVTMEDPYTSIGSQATAVVNSSALLAEGLEGSMKISILHNDTRSYLTMDGILAAEPTWIPLLAVDRRIVLPFSIEDAAPYTVIVELDSRRESYSAMTRTNSLGAIKLMDDISDIHMFNQQLIITTMGGDTKLAEGIKLGFTIDHGIAEFANHFNLIQPIYE